MVTRGSLPDHEGGCRSSRTLCGVPEVGAEVTEEALEGVPGPQDRAF